MTEPSPKKKGSSKPGEGKRASDNFRSPKVLNQHHNDQTQPATSDFSRPPADENATTSAAVPVKNRKRNQRRRGQSRSSESSCVNDTHRTETEESEPGQSPQTRPGGASQRRRRRNKGPCVIQDGAADSDGASGSGQMPSKQPDQQPKQQRHRKRKPKLAVESLDLGHLQPTQGEEPLLVNAIAQNGAEQEKKKKKKKRNKPKTHVEERTEDGLIAVAATEKATLTKKMQSPLKKAKASQCQVQSSSSPGSASRGNRGGRRRRLFEDYMSVEDVSAGLKRGELIQGVLRINPKKYQDAFIPSPDGLADIFLDGFVARNRALNGDVVVVKLLPREQWKVLNGEESEQTPVKKQEGRPTASCSPDVIVEAQYNNGEEEEELVHQMKSVSLQEQGPATKKNEEHRNISSSSGIASDKTVQRTAKVVYIVEQKHSRAASGFIKFLLDKTFAMFSPVDHRVPRVNVPLSDCPADFPSRPGDYANTLFICRITHWPADNSFAEGRLAKSLGQAGEIEPETEGILTEYDVDFSEFSEEALACLPQTLPWTIPPEEFAKRKDLRKQCIFTIDPATARDLDDALSCTKLPDGNFEVGVHIADVSYFVEEASALDLVASQRATSVYLVQKVIPMLPRLLCEELCSLNPQTDRLAFSVIWTLSPEGKILSQWFGRSVIRSCVKLSYDHAQSMIEEPGKRFIPDELPPVSPEHSVQQVHEAVLHLHTIAKHLRAQRFESGALRLDQMKLAFTLDADMAMPQGCYIYQYRDSNKLVEEFMLLANMAVAHQIYSSYRTLALLRRHPTPQSRMMEVLQELCDQMGLNIDLSSAGALHRSLNESVGNDEYSTARKEVLTHMCSRPMQMAVYFCTGVLNDEKLFRHYALNVPLYTHFTSPIRRYADLIVHRLLAASLKCGPRFRMSEDEVQKQASHCNDKKMASKRVQELSSELFFSVFVRECGPLDSEAMVMGMLDKALDVLVLRYGVQKRIYCNAIEGLQSFNFRRVGKRPEMTLIWTPDDVGQDSIQQDISLFSLLHVQLKSDGVPLKYSAVLKRPAETQP